MGGAPCSEVCKSFAGCHEDGPWPYTQNEFEAIVRSMGLGSLQFESSEQEDALATWNPSVSADTAQWGHVASNRSKEGRCAVKPSEGVRRLCPCLHTGDAGLPGPTRCETSLDGAAECFRGRRCNCPAKSSVAC